MPADIGFTLNFFGFHTNQVFVNNNGNITLGTPLPSFTPSGLTTSNGGIPIIAAFFADVDTRGRGDTTYGTATLGGRRAFGVNWIDVGYFSGHADLTNSFQLILISRADTGAGNFDIEFNYDQILWETGDASGGSKGLGGESARVGFSNGTGEPGTQAELSGSGVNGAFLDDGPLSLARGSNTDTPGRYLFSVRGQVFTAGRDTLVTSGSGHAVRNIPGFLGNTLEPTDDGSTEGSIDGSARPVVDFNLNLFGPRTTVVISIDNFPGVRGGGASAPALLGGTVGIVAGTSAFSLIEGGGGTRWTSGGMLTFGETTPAITGSALDPGALQVLQTDSAWRVLVSSDGQPLSAGATPFPGGDLPGQAGDSHVRQLREPSPVQPEVSSLAGTPLAAVVIFLPRGVPGQAEATRPRAGAIAAEQQPEPLPSVLDRHETLDGPRLYRDTEENLDVSSAPVSGVGAQTREQLADHVLATLALFSLPGFWGRLPVGAAVPRAGRYNASMPRRRPPA